MSKNLRTFLAILWCGCAALGTAYAQETASPDSAGAVAEVEGLEPAPPAAQVFVSIELTNEGVTAIDSAGNRWYYNFNTETFVEARDDALDERPLRDPDRTVEVADPVDKRCTERLKVDRASLRAVYVGYDEYVDGNIEAFNRVTIKGWVKGNVQSFNKPVLVTASGQVDGDIRAPEIEVKPGGIVLGRQIITQPSSAVPDYITTRFSAVGIWVVFGFTLALLLLDFLSASLVPRHTGRVVDCVLRYPLRCFLLGLVLVFLLPVILTLVIITVVGILLVPLVPFALLLALAFGMTAVTTRFAGLLMRRDFADPRALLVRSLVAVVGYMALWALVAILLGANGSGGDALQGFGIALLVISIIVTVHPFLSGLGALALTRFGTRDYISFRERSGPDTPTAAAPAPPPMPEAPLRPRPFIPTPPRPGIPPDKLRPPSEGR